MGVIFLFWLWNFCVFSLFWRSSRVGFCCFIWCFCVSYFFCFGVLCLWFCGMLFFCICLVECMVVLILWVVGLEFLMWRERRLCMERMVKVCGRILIIWIIKMWGFGGFWFVLWNLGISYWRRFLCLLFLIWCILWLSLLLVFLWVVWVGI